MPVTSTASRGNAAAIPQPNQVPVFGNNGFTGTLNGPATATQRATQPIIPPPPSFNGPINGPATATQGAVRNNDARTYDPNSGLPPVTGGQMPATDTITAGGVSGNPNLNAAISAVGMSQNANRFGARTNRRNPRASQSLTPEQLKKAAASRLGI
jgi:hypothetical protein